MKKIRCILKEKKTEKGKRLPLLPLPREEGEGAAEVQGQGKNGEKRRGKEEKKERAREKKSVRGRSY